MPVSKMAEICRVCSVSQSLIQIEVLDHEEFKKHTNEQNLTIGTYLQIKDTDGHSIIAVVQSYRIKDPTLLSTELPSGRTQFVLDAQPVGFITASGEFKRGGQQIAIPPTEVSIAGSDVLRSIYTSTKQRSLSLGGLAQDDSIDVPIDGDKFFGKHIAVVGSTGSGKSCAVARILQEGIKKSDGQTKAGVLNNSHIVVFDLHGEYASAFPEARILTVDTLRLPYWLMNAEELEELFIMTAEDNAHNQVAYFRHAVTQNKIRKNKTLPRVSFDTPVYFNLEEVYRYISNMNTEVIGKLQGENVPCLLKNRTRVPVREEVYFDSLCEFVPQSTANADKASKGPFTNEFDRFVFRLRTVLDDERLAFLLHPQKEKGGEYQTADLEELLADLTGYGKKNQSNVTIVDLSGIPFEVTSLVVSLLSRIVFDVGFYLKRAGSQEAKTDIPILAVYEEAHIYAPKSEAVRFRSVTRSIERIAKEGRKYGVCLMIVSQRPSEIAETIFSQCNNFVAMRLTNPTDQNYVKRLLPDSVAGITGSLPTLEQREALIIGDAVTVPTLVKVADIQHKPDSRDIKVLTEWQDDWRKLPFARVIEGMKKR